MKCLKAAVKVPIEKKVEDTGEAQLTREVWYLGK